MYWKRDNPSINKSVFVLKMSQDCFRHFCITKRALKKKEEGGRMEEKRSEWKNDRKKAIEDWEEEEFREREGEKETSILILCK